MAVAKGLGEEPVSQLPALKGLIQSEPGDDGDRQRATGQSPDEIDRQISKIDLASRQRIEASNQPVRAEQCLRCGKPFLLMLEGPGAQPVVDLGLAAIEPAAWMALLERFQSKAIRPHDPVHERPCIIAPSCFWAAVSRGGVWSACQKASCSSGLN